MKKKTFNSLFEIPIPRPCRGTCEPPPFNSLFEILTYVSVSPVALCTVTFNSLFEILSWWCWRVGVHDHVQLSILFLRFGSYGGETRKPAIGLSILFLRFGRVLEHLDRYLREHRFQFSFWDSLVRWYARFSWDSLSILFLRFWWIRLDQSPSTS